MPRPSRATAHHLSEIAPTATPATPPRAGSFCGPKADPHRGPRFRRVIAPMPPLLHEIQTPLSLRRTRAVSFDDLIGSGEDRGRDCKAERVCSFEVDDKF